MAQYGPGNLRIESFARLLFDQWDIGYKDAEGQSWDRGILLLVSAQDRQARIELGPVWGRDFDPKCKRIMDEQMVFHFRQSDYTGGIVAGVQGLDKMARGLPLPARSRPKWQSGLVSGTIVLGLLMVYSLSRRGASGWAWAFWRAVFSFLGNVLHETQPGSRRRSGGFSGSSLGGPFHAGGSFGGRSPGGFTGGRSSGGFRGGGGATGSW